MSRALFDTEDEYINALSGNNILLLEPFIGMTVKRQHRCLCCDSVLIKTPRNIIDAITKTGTHCCRVCLVNSQTKDNEYYTNEMLVYNITPMELYKTARTPIWHRCNICGHDWKKSPNRMKVIPSCPSCKEMSWMGNTEDTYLKNLSKRFPTIIMLGDFAGPQTAIDHACIKCERVWEVKPVFMMHHYVGCRGCAAINATLTHDEYLEKLLISTDGKYICEDVYTHNKTKMMHFHECGYRWKVRPDHLLSGRSRCPSCFKPKLKLFKPGKLIATRTKIGDQVFHSKLEAACAEQLFDRFTKDDIDCGRRYNQTRRWRVDFYVKSLDLWIEVSNFVHQKYNETIFEKRKAVKNFIFANSPKQLMEMIDEFLARQN